MRAGAHYVEHVLLHLVGSAGHIVLSDASRAQNVDTLFSCSGGPDVVSIKSALGYVTLNFCFCILWICGSCRAFWSIRGEKHRCTILHAWVGPVWFP
jgi:hypothetical protein